MNMIRKYACVFRIALSERLVYRTDFFLGTVLRFAPMATTILLWRAIYTAAGAAHIDGYRYSDMVAYYLMTMLSRAFSSMPGLAASIARDVKQGTIQRFLIQPVDQVGYLLMLRAAHKSVYYGVAAGPFVLLFVLCRGYFPGWPPPLVCLAGVVSFVLAFLLGFFFETCMGLLAFWFLEVSSFLFIVMTLNYFLSGHMLPLDLLPGPLAAVLRQLPFQYLCYFPTLVWLGRLEPQAVAAGLVAQLGWTVLFAMLARLAYRRGLRRYTAFGG
jgi:ABC-2 type transport system permease protein